MARCTCCEQASQSETQIWNPHVDVQVAENTASHRITWSGAGQLTFSNPDMLLSWTPLKSQEYSELSLVALDRSLLPALLA